MVKSRRRVLPQAAGEGHPVGVAGIGVAPVHPVGGDFQGLPFQQNRYRTMADAGLNDRQS